MVNGNHSCKRHPPKFIPKTFDSLAHTSTQFVVKSAGVATGCSRAKPQPSTLGVYESVVSVSMLKMWRSKNKLAPAPAPALALTLPTTFIDDLSKPTTGTEIPLVQTWSQMLIPSALRSASGDKSASNVAAFCAMRTRCEKPVTAAAPENADCNVMNQSLN